MRKAIDKLSPDLIQCNGIWKMHTHVTVCESFRAGIPCVVAGRGNFSQWAMRHHHLRKQIAWWLYQKKDLQRAAAFHATSDSECEYIRKLGFKQPVIVVPNGIDGVVDEVRFAHLYKQRLRRLEKTAVRKVFFLSRIHFQKGLKELLETWAILNRQMQSRDGNADERSIPYRWILEIAGTDNCGFQDNLINYATKLGLHVIVVKNEEDNSVSLDRGVRHSEEGDREEVGAGYEDIAENMSVVFSGPKSDGAKWESYARADVFVLPSYSENFGLVIAEALYAGVPVIATKDRTPWSELVSEGCGSWVPLDVDVWATALEKMMAMTDSERLNMGINGHTLILRKYTWKTIAIQMKTAYEWLVYGGDKPDCIRV